MLSSRIKKSMSRTNSTNKVNNKANVRPNSEYTLNKKTKYNK